MQDFHLFRDERGRVVAIENDPEALDKAPYETIVYRLSKGLVSEEAVDQAINQSGGQIIFANQKPLIVDVY